MVMKGGFIAGLSCYTASVLSSVIYSSQPSEENKKASQLINQSLSNPQSVLQEVSWYQTEHRGIRLTKKNVNKHGRPGQVMGIRPSAYYRTRPKLCRSECECLRSWKNFTSWVQTWGCRRGGRTEVGAGPPAVSTTAAWFNSWGRVACWRCVIMFKTTELSSFVSLK